MMLRLTVAAAAAILVVQPARAEQTEVLARWKSMGLEALAVSPDGRWCGETVTLRLIGEDPGALAREKLADFVVRIGGILVEKGACPTARRVVVEARLQGKDDAVSTGTATIESRWILTVNAPPKPAAPPPAVAAAPTATPETVKPQPQAAPAAPRTAEQERQREAFRQSILAQIDSVMRLPLGPRISTVNGSPFNGFVPPIDLTDADSIGAMVLGKELDGYAIVRMADFSNDIARVDWPRPMRILVKQAPPTASGWMLVRGFGRIAGKAKAEAMGKSFDVPLVEIRPYRTVGCQQPYCAEYTDKAAVLALIERQFGKGTP